MHCSSTSKHQLACFGYAMLLTVLLTCAAWLLWLSHCSPGYKHTTHNTTSGRLLLSTALDTSKWWVTLAVMPTSVLFDHAFVYFGSVLQQQQQQQQQQWRHSKRCVFASSQLAVHTLSPVAVSVHAPCCHQLYNLHLG
jgi:hypothetical protein